MPGSNEDVPSTSQVASIDTQAHGAQGIQLKICFMGRLLRPNNSFGRVSSIPHALINVAPASQRKMLVADRRVDLALEL